MIGKKLREFRRLKHLSQGAFGAKIAASYAQINSWERDKIPIPRWALIALQREYSLNEAWLRGESQAMFTVDAPVEPVVAEEAAAYGLDRAEQKLLKEVEELLRDADDDVKRHLRDELKLLRLVPRSQKKRASSKN